LSPASVAAREACTRTGHCIAAVRKERTLISLAVIPEQIRYRATSQTLRSKTTVSREHCAKKCRCFHIPLTFATITPCLEDHPT
jgi:hypothetical protein